MLRLHLKQRVVNPVSAKPFPPSQATGPPVHETDKELLQAGHAIETVLSMAKTSNGSPVIFSHVATCSDEGWYSAVIASNLWAMWSKGKSPILAICGNRKVRSSS